MFPYGETVIVLRAVPGGVDAYGDPVEAEDVQEWHEGCAVWTGGGRSDAEPVLQGREPVASDITVALPAGADVLRTDRLVVRDREYDVAGEPFDYRSPLTGWRPGTVVNANRAEG